MNKDPLEELLLIAKEIESSKIDDYINEMDRKLDKEIPKKLEAIKKKLDIFIWRPSEDAILDKRVKTQDVQDEYNKVLDIDLYLAKILELLK